MSKIQIGRGAVYLYIENISSMILGYAFWLILSRMISPETVGISSSYISFAMIFISIASIGVPLGAQRFLGKMFAEKRFEDAMVFVKSSFFIVSLGLSASTLIILGSGYIFFDHFRFILIVASMVLIVISTVSILLRSIFIASLNTKKVLLASTISSAIKLIVAVILVSLGTGEVGVLISFAVAPLITSTILALDLRALLKQASKMTLVRFSDSLRLLLKSSVVSWIPLSIEALGTQLGTIIVLGIQGSTQAGFYFIAFQISMGISAVIWAIEGTAYPALSSMENGRERFVWRTIKVSLLILLPISFAIIFYSTSIIQLFGQSYSEGSTALQILLLSVGPNAIMNGIGILTYAYGNYRHVLIIGLASTVPRLLLYFILVPMLGGTGAGLSYTLGTIVGLIASIVISKKIGLIIPWKEVALMTAVPLVIAFLFSGLNVHPLLGITLSILGSYLIYLKLMLIDRKDVQDYLQILPGNIANPLNRIVDRVARKINGRY